MDLYDEVEEEIAKQHEKWGVQNHSPAYWMIILMEEVGEACKELCGKGVDLKAYREEMVQVIAVDVSALECFDREEEVNART